MDAKRLWPLRVPSKPIRISLPIILAVVLRPELWPKPVIDQRHSAERDAERGQEHREDEDDFNEAHVVPLGRLRGLALDEQRVTSQIVQRLFRFFCSCVAAIVESCLPNNAVKICNTKNKNLTAKCLVVFVHSSFDFAPLHF